jgi:DHA1 family multidrug resistance protein-like MFS transporter
LDPDSQISEIVEEAPLEDEKVSQGMRQVWMLAFSLAILQIGFGIVTPIFPFYIEELGATATGLGFLAASFALTRIAFAGPLGTASDRVGRKPILLGALLGYAFANVVYAFAPNILVMIGARSLEGAVSAGFYPAANAFVSDLTTPKNRGTAMGYLSTGNMVGFVVGPTIGGVLAQFLGIRLPFILAAIATVITLIAVQILVKEPERLIPKESDEKPQKIPLRLVFGANTKANSILALSMFANMFAMGILEVAFVLDAVTRLNFTPIEIGAFFGVLGIVMIIGNIAFGKISDRIGRKLLISIGALIGGISLFLFMVASELTGFYVAGIALGIGISMRGPTIQALIADLTDRRAYGTIMGFFGAVSNSAYVVGPITGGYLLDTTGTAASALAIAGFVSYTGAIAAAVGLPSKPERGIVVLPDDFLEADSSAGLNVS